MISEFEKEQDKVRKANEIYLEDFEEYLINKGLSEKTISKQILNVDFYINHFLCYYDVLEVEHGCYKINQFLGDWFIRKSLWSS